MTARPHFANPAAPAALAAAALAACVAPLSGQDPSDEAFDPALPDTAYYAPIWERSPFIVETKVVEQSDGLARRYTLTGIGKLDDEPVAFLLDTQSLLRFAVSRTRPRDGIELVSVAPASDLKESFATIRRGAEEAVLKYDPSSLRLSADTGVAAQTIAADQPHDGAPRPVARTQRTVPPVTAADPAQQKGQPIPPEPEIQARRRLIKTAD